jgi:hypothetical protein
MSNATGMSAPVTRGELREELERFATKTELERFATKADLERFATKADLERFATKADLELWGGALAERIAESHRELSAELAERIAGSHRKLAAELAERIAESHRKLSAELAGHANGHLESTSRDISVLDDKYNSLPPRVENLEDAVRKLNAGRPKRR